jgi:hypothetical protein
MYKILAQIGIGAFLLISIWFLIKQNQELKSELVVQKDNVESYEQGLQTYKDKYGVLHNTSIQQSEKIVQIQNSKDSVKMALTDSIKKYQIKLKDVQQMGQIQTTLIVRDTVEVAGLRDTTIDLSTKPYIDESIQIRGNKLSRDLGINNTQSLIWHSKDLRKNGKPASKIFFIRWFQSIHKQYSVDVVNSNPFIRETNQQFIHVDN